MIDSESVQAAAFSINQDGRWELRAYTTLADTLLVQTIQMELPLRSIYEGTYLSTGK